jgi:hypothetical protein
MKKKMSLRPAGWPNAFSEHFGKLLQLHESQNSSTCLQLPACAQHHLWLRFAARG